MSTVWVPFIPADDAPGQLPLGRFLPPIPAGMLRAWLKEHAPPGSWVIDPLGSTPAVPLEAAQAGYRVLVASNNPVLSFMLEVLAAAPKKTDFLAALADLGSARRGEERLEQYLRGMYQTTCDSCNQEIQPQAYIWRRDEKIPAAKLYHCLNCGDQGERKITERDIERLNLIGKDSLHRSRASERVRIGGGAVEPAAEEAIQAYLPRPLDFLFTLINKIDGLFISKERRRLLTALALSACDEGSALWSWPNARNRPRQLGIPPQFRENNLWLALENAIEAWTIQDEPVALSTWPALPPAGGGICLIPGRIHSIGALPETLRPSAAVAAIPRPNQAFWTLCAVWAGWMWGREAALPLRKALERRRYDWNWHTAALHTTLNHLYQLVPPNFPFWGVLSEMVPGFLSAAMTGSEAAGFHLETLSLLEDEEMAQIGWQTRPHPAAAQGGPGRTTPVYKEAITAALLERNQPASYSTLLAAGLTGLAQAGLLLPGQSNIEQDSLSRLHQPFDHLLNDGSFVIRYRGGSQSMEGGSWWLRNPPQTTALPLSDQVEMEIVRHLQKFSGCTFKEIQSVLFPLFPGLKTPLSGLITACLESYGETDVNEPGRWQLRPSETSARRRADIAEMIQMLRKFAGLFQFECRGEEVLEWTDETGSIAFRFYIFASSIISRYVEGSFPEEPIHHVLVLPGSRSNLLAYKLRENPHLEEAVQHGWHFLKFRHLRRIGERENITPAQFLELLGQDPPLWEEPKQMAFF